MLFRTRSHSPVNMIFLSPLIHSMYETFQFSHFLKNKFILQDDGGTSENITKRFLVS